jgi:uncharacterized protein YkwD
MTITPFSSTRTTWPDIVALRASVRTATADATAEVSPVEPFNMQKWVVQTAADLTGPISAAVQAALDSGAAYTPQHAAQDHIDGWPIELKALALALVDQLNVIRAALPVPLGAITVNAAIAAIRTKAGTL